MTRLKSDRMVPPPKRYVPPPQGTLKQTQVFLDRGPCFGDCPSYQVSITGDGKVRYQGQSSVLVAGRHRSEVDPEAVRCLVEDFKTADFWSLASRYQASVTDNPGNLVRIRVGKHNKQVFDYVGEAVGMPSIVRALEQEIDRVATGPWVLGDAQTIPLLKGEGFDFRSPAGAGMLRQALARSSDEIVLALLAEGIDPNVAPKKQDFYGQSAMAAAGSRKTPAALAALLDRGLVDRKAAGEALISAASFGRVENVAFLLRSSADANYRDENGDIALTRAHGNYEDSDADQKQEQLAIIRALLDAGADPKARNKSGSTALDSTESVEALRLLIQSGADVNAEDEDGHTPLSSVYTDEAALLLLEAGANPDAKRWQEGSFIAAAKEHHWTKTLAWLAAHRKN